MFDVEKLIKIRKEHNISRTELARAANIPLRTIEDWEYGKTNITKTEHLNRIAKTLNYSLQDFCKDGVEIAVKNKSIKETPLSGLDFYTNEEMNYILKLLNYKPGSVVPVATPEEMIYKKLIISKIKRALKNKINK